MRARTGLVLITALVALGCERSDAPRAEDVAANNRGVGLMGMFDYQKAEAGG
jgi:hypothetical protein